MYDTCRMTEIVGVRDLGRNPSGVLDRVAEQGEPLVISRSGRPVAVLVPLGESGFESWVHGEIDAAIATRPSARYRAPAIPKAQGFRKARKRSRLELPTRLQWSHPGAVYDMQRPSDRARVYEIVLREGSADDVAEYVAFADLESLWPTMFLPGHVKSAWEAAYPSLRGA